jgi:hypothetical protein
MGWIILNGDWNVTSVCDYSWRIYSGIIKAQTYSWRILSNVAKALSYSWLIGGMISKALVYSWTIQNNLTASILGYSWKVYAYFVSSRPSLISKVEIRKKVFASRTPDLLRNEEKRHRFWGTK